MSTANETRNPAPQTRVNRFSTCCGDAASWTRAEEQSTFGCPMAGMCGGLGARMGTGAKLLVVLFGLVLLGLAAAILLEPQVLAWMAAAVLALIGLGVIVLALYPAALFVGFVIAAFAISEWAIRRQVTTPKPLQRFGAFALVVAALFLAYALPWIGGWLALITLLFGLGALGQTLFAGRSGQPMAS